jgi:hypothetical protein
MRFAPWVVAVHPLFALDFFSKNQPKIMHDFPKHLTSCFLLRLYYRYLADHCRQQKAMCICIILAVNCPRRGVQYAFKKQLLFLSRSKIQKYPEAGHFWGDILIFYPYHAAQKVIGWSAQRSNYFTLSRGRQYHFFLILYHINIMAKKMI